MQVSKHDGHQWDTIINIVLSSLGFAKRFIDHDFNTFRKNSTKDVLIVGFYIDAFMCGCWKYFPVTPKEGPQLSYLNKCII